MTSHTSKAKWHHLEFPNGSGTIQPRNLVAVLKDQSRYYKEIADAIPLADEMTGNDVHYLIGDHPRWQSRFTDCDSDSLSWGHGFLQCQREMADKISRTLREIVRIAGKDA